MSELKSNQLKKVTEVYPSRNKQIRDPDRLGQQTKGFVKGQEISCDQLDSLSGMTKHGQGIRQGRSAYCSTNQGIALYPC